ncbi:hypothetical protein [Phenylobacterium sp.]|uniref:hypothetical protein n=1 Tax=Phenylobacterium sp. TaxID=1871053 RepID=UPI002E305B75|nr:hypothetical protein [Phenylobacterium sp.]HEX3364580.1 hypothetical protein [Phenylobacterium sp.]
MAARKLLSRSRSAGRPSHRALNARWRRVGERLTLRLKGGTFTFKPRRTPTARLLPQVREQLKSASRFNAGWRGADLGTDELVSTSSVRELLTGLVGRLPANPSRAEEAEVDRIIAILSDVRLDTAYSGFASRERVMQHPAPAETSVFADPARTASEHAALDVERKSYVLKRVEDYMDGAGASASATEVVREAAKAAIEFTLNGFTAPVAADNVFRYSRLGLNGALQAGPEAEAQVRARERLKQAYQDLGGELRPAPLGETAANRMTRDWAQTEANANPSMLQRRPSAARLDLMAS